MRKGDFTRLLLALVVLFSIVQLAMASPLTPIYGAEANPTGNPIGGGNGYNDIIAHDDPRVIAVVSDKAGLLAALRNARAGDIVYVDGSANIDMTGTFSVAIPAGVTLASNRGENGAPGGRIYQERVAGDPTGNLRIFVTSGPNIRITGLRIQGPDPTRTRSVPDSRYGIWSAHHSLEVDNCEIYEFGFAGIRIQNTGPNSGQYIHHNHIHTNQREGLGYGIALYGSEALIEANLFDYNRHSITSSGSVGSGFEARYNIIGPNGTNSDFDMHQDSSDPNWGGDWVWIHHNTFLNPDAYAFAQRGYPRVGAWVEYNVFDSRNYPAPVRQRYHGGETEQRYGRIYVSNNIVLNEFHEYGWVSYHGNPTYVEPTPYPINPRAPEPTPTPTPIPTPEIFEVSGVVAIDDIEVDYGTSFEHIGLPGTALVILHDGSERTVDLDWSITEATYNGETSGTYTLEGLLVNLPDNIVNPDGNVAYVNVIVGTPPAILPVAAFTASVTYGTAPLTVHFTDESTGSPVAWEWDFGDETTSTVENPSKTYTKPGTYTVSLKVTNADGTDTLTKTEYITVQYPDTEHTEHISLKVTAGTDQQALGFGTHIDATDGFDEGLTVPAPPLPPAPKFDAVFRIADPKFPRVYTDMRGPLDDIVTERVWTMEIISKATDAIVSWDKDAIPEGMSYTLTYAGVRYDMTSVSMITIPQDEYGTPRKVDITLSSQQQMVIPLSPGWNLISVPYANAELTVTNPDAIQVIYPTSPSSPGGDIIPLESMKQGKAYWIASTIPNELIVKGTEASPIIAEMSRGWNLIGGTHREIRLADIITEPSGAWTLPFIYGYNAERRGYEQMTTIEPGRGYWGAMRTNCIITIP